MSWLRTDSEKKRLDVNCSRNGGFRDVSPVVLILLLSASTAWAAYGGGSGTEGAPYLIASAEQMQAIGADPCDWDKHFKLTADIDLSGYTGTQFNLIGHYTTPFTGVFDGNDHTISNFTYNALLTGGVGIFSIINGPDAEVKDLGIINPSIIAGTGGYGGIGALVGYMDNATISNCYMINGSISGGHSTAGLIGDMENGTVSDCYVQGAGIYGEDWRIGGLVGSVEAGTVSNCYTTTCSVSGFMQVGGLAGIVYSGATVTNCFSHSSVVGNSDTWPEPGECISLGGLIGTNHGTVSVCYATGDVLGESGAGQKLGGLMGYNGGLVSDCYATGDVADGGYEIGGLIGYAYSPGTVSNCYSTGSVSGPSEVGGLMGNNYGTVTDCFWDKETSGCTTSAGGTGKTTGEMKDVNTFLNAGWDLVGDTTNGTDDIWTMCSCGGCYPKLAPNMEIPSLLGDSVVPDGVDINDLAFFVEHWLESNCAGQYWTGGPCGADLNGSGAVDFEDYALFGQYWSSELMLLIGDEDFETGDFSKYDW